jgi:hypothetical protein
MSTNIIDTATFGPDGVTIPTEATQDEWAAIHRSIMLCGKAHKAWLKQSRAFATERWGEDYLAETEVQLEMALGIEPPKETPKLNPADKSSAIVTIEGISQQFTLWHRKMDAEIAGWDKPKIEKALGLLEPIEREAKRLRWMLETNSN